MNALKKITLITGTKETAIESIETLIQLGIDHLDYVPYCPGMHNVDRTETAVTPGEIDLIPPFVKKVVNIRPRLIDITTIIILLQHLRLLEKKGQDISGKYMHKIIELSSRLADSNSQARQLNKYLNTVLNGVNDGIIAVNYAGEITVFNENVENILKTPVKQAIGKKVQTAIPYPELANFISERGSKEEDRWFTLDHVEIVVHRFHLPSEKTIVSTLKNARETILIEKTLRRDFERKEYLAKHQFSSIIGNSPSIKSTIKIAEKLVKYTFLNKRTAAWTFSILNPVSKLYQETRIYWYENC